GQRSVERTLRPSATLALACLDDALAHGGAAFDHDLGPQQFTGGLPRYRDLQVDPIADRAGKARPVTLPLERGALAESLRIAGKTAGAGIGRCDQDEAAGKHRVPPGPRD